MSWFSARLSRAFYETQHEIKPGKRHNIPIADSMFLPNANDTRPLFKTSGEMAPFELERETRSKATGGCSIDFTQQPGLLR